MSEIKIKFGKRLKYLREQKGYTQEQLAEILDMNCRSLSFIECGTNFVTAQTLDKLCHALNVTPKQFFDFDYNEKTPEEIVEVFASIVREDREKAHHIYKIVKSFTD